MSNRRYLYVLVFVCGLVTLGGELASSRLVAPYFGTSLPVWSSLIGVILLALALGYLLGGRLADRSPRLPVLLHVVMVAAVWLVCLPLASRLVLHLLLSALVGFRWGLLLGSFLGIVMLLGVPMVLLGCVTPFAVRLASGDVHYAGRVAGRLFACSTLGSFVGSFLPVLILVPVIGTRATFVLFGVLLMLVCAPGYLLSRRKAMAALSLLLVPAAAVCGRFLHSTPIRPGTRVLYEGESPYQYVRVDESRSGWRRLRLNEGFVTHSKYHPAVLLTYGEWDYFTLAPYFNPAPYDPLERARRWALIGSGAGTTARLLTAVYGPIPIDGVELDPLVVQVGREYFDMTSPNFRVTVQDGRAWLNTTTNTYDVVAVDAYRQPYIPFELTTVEFFQRVHEHLSDTGVVCINVATPLSDRRLLRALASTIGRVFPSVFLLPLRERSQATLVIGTKQRAEIEDFRRNIAGAVGLIAELAGPVLGRVEPYDGEGLILTDDRAPVERLMDVMLYHTIMARR